MEHSIILSEATIVLIGVGIGWSAAYIIIGVIYFLFFHRWPYR